MSNEKNPKKNVPTIFPSGYSVAKVDEGNVMVVEFLDRDHDGLNIVGSFAMTSKRARDLAESIIKGIEQNSEKEISSIQGIEQNL